MSELAGKLARRDGTAKTMEPPRPWNPNTEAVIDALEANRQTRPMTERFAAGSDRAAGLSRPGGRAVGTHGIDRMWDHERGA